MRAIKQGLALIIFIAIAGCGQAEKKDPSVTESVVSKPQPTTLGPCDPSAIPIPLGLGPNEVRLPITQPSQLADGRYRLMRAEIYVDYRSPSGRAQIHASESISSTGSRHEVLCRTPFKKDMNLNLAIPALSEFQRMASANPVAHYFEHTNWNFRVVSGFENWQTSGTDLVREDGYFDGFMQNAFGNDWTFFLGNSLGALIYEVRAHRTFATADSIAKVQMKWQFNVR